MEDELTRQTEKIMESIDVPSQPRILIAVNNELASAEPDFGKLADLVASDVAMSAKILKIVGSPFFGLKAKVSSIKQALGLLGIDTFSTTVLASSLEDALVKKNCPKKEMELFWDHSTLVANVSRCVASKLHMDANEAYMAGLFHDTAMMILGKKFPDYLASIKENAQAAEDLVLVEEELFGTNHCIAGYLIAKSWKLPDSVCQSIKYHHSPDLSSLTDARTRRQVAVLLLAESIISRNNEDYSRITNIYDFDVRDVEAFAMILLELDLSPEDFEDIVDEVGDLMSLN